MQVPIFLKDKYIFISFALAAILGIVAFGIAYSNLSDSGNLLVIHFDSFRGADYFGTQSDVWDILAAAAVVWLMNLALANELYFRERLLSYMLASSVLFFNLLILFAVNAIISIN